MAKKPVLDQYDQMLAQIAKLLIEEVNTVRKRWELAFVGILFPPTGPGTGGLGKFRVKHRGHGLASASMPIEPACLINDLWTMQKGRFPKTWFGIKITIYPDGRHEAEYDFSPDCLKKKGDAFLDG